MPKHIVISARRNEFSIGTLLARTRSYSAHWSSILIPLPLISFLPYFHFSEVSQRKGFSLFWKLRNWIQSRPLPATLPLLPILPTIESTRQSVKVSGHFNSIQTTFIWIRISPQPIARKGTLPTR